MKVTKLNQDQVEIKINDQSVTLFASDLIASLAATMGAGDYLHALVAGHSKLADSLYSQNQGAVGTEDYDASRPNAGKELEKLMTSLNNTLSTIYLDE
jgi:hypothetical protein